MPTTRSLAWRRIGAAAAALTIALALGSGVARAAAPAGEPSARPGPAIVVEAASGGVLFAASPDIPWYPASLTKLMTLYLGLEALAHGRLDPDAGLPVSAAASAQPPTRLGLRAGARLSVSSALTALVTVSANDVAVVIAEALAGDEPAFVSRMNATAGRLGLASTRFANATGLPSAGQRTTARDVATLARRLLLDFPHHARLFSLPGITFAGRYHGSHNRLLATVPGADGMKTGFTCAAGYNLVLTATREGRQLLAVVLGAGSRGERDRLARGLIDTGFAGELPAVAGTAIEVRDRRGPSALAPPARLSPAECAEGTPRPRLRIVRSVNTLRGWGIFLGNLTDQSEAEGLALRVHRELGLAGSGRRAAVLARTATSGAPGASAGSWKVVLAGLSPAEAGAACRRLWGLDRLCIAQSPERIAMPGYAMQ